MTWTTACKLSTPIVKCKSGQIKCILLTQIPQKERINSLFSARKKPHFPMYSVLLPIISMISLEYSRHSCITRSSFLFADMWKTCEISFQSNNKLFFCICFSINRKSRKQAKVFLLWYNNYYRGYYLWALCPNHYNLRRLKKWLRQLIKLLKFSWEMLLI